MDNELYERYKKILSYEATGDHFAFCPGIIDPSIQRGITRDHCFSVPFNIDIVERLRISYVQNGNVIIEKTLDDINVKSEDYSIIYFTLNENETLKFDAKFNVQVQLKAQVDFGRLIASNVYVIDVIDSIDPRALYNTDLDYTAIDVNVNCQDVVALDYFSLISSSVKSYKVRFLFDSTWDDMSRIEAIFKDEYFHEERVLLNKNDNYSCNIPASVLEKPGRLYISVIGSYKGNGAEEADDIERPTEWSNAVFVRQSLSSISKEE